MLVNPEIVPVKLRFSPPPPASSKAIQSMRSEGCEEVVLETECRFETLSLEQNASPMPYEVEGNTFTHTHAMG
jgi:hypothetical protein